MWGMGPTGHGGVGHVGHGVRRTGACGARGPLGHEVPTLLFRCSWFVVAGALSPAQVLICNLEATPS